MEEKLWFRVCQEMVTVAFGGSSADVVDVVLMELAHK